MFCFKQKPADEKRMRDWSSEGGSSELLEKASARAERAVKAGRAQSESRNMGVQGDRRLIDITEAPVGAGLGAPDVGGDGTVGTARDLTTLEQMQSELARHVEAHAEVLETLHTAVAVFGPDKRLIFANTAFGRLWGVDRKSTRLNSSH